MLLIGAENLLQVPAKCDHRAHQFVAREVPAVGIVDGRAVLHVFFVGANPAVAHRLHERDRVVPGIDGNLPDNRADFIGRRIRRDRFAKGNRHRAVGRCTEHVRTTIAVVRTPEALGVERHDNGVRPLNSLRIVDAEGFHVRRPRNFARREYHHGVARQEPLANFLHGFFRMAIVDTNHSESFQHGSQVPFLEVVLVAGNAKRTRGSHLHHGPVDKAMVVANKEHRPVVRDVAHVQDTNLVAAKGQAQNRTDKGLRQIEDRPVEHADRHDGKAEEIELRPNRGVAD